MVNKGKFITFVKTLDDNDLDTSMSIIKELAIKQETLETKITELEANFNDLNNKINKLLSKE